jgi:histone H3/H4
MQEDGDDHTASGGGAMMRDTDADHHLPVANISRIMKKILPTNAQVSKVLKRYF